MARNALIAAGLVVLAALGSACNKDGPPPAAPAPPSDAEPGQSIVYPQPGEPGATNVGHPPRPGQPDAPPSPGQMVVPGLGELTCQSDWQCISHRCNPQTQRCAFPCRSDADCIHETTCFGAGNPKASCMPRVPRAR
jgi:hypothetical protein